MKSWHLFGWNKVSISESQLKQISGKFAQRGHGIIQATRLSLIMVKKAICAGFVWQKQVWKLLLHMVLIMPEVAFLRVVYIPKAVLVCNEGFYFFGNGCIFQFSSPSFGKGRVREDIVS